jgi:hypothetical protein
MSEGKVARRFPIKRSAFWRPILTLFGAIDRWSYIEITPDVMRVRYSWYYLTIPRERIVAVDEQRWRMLWGIGWRSDLRRRVALIGAQEPVLRFEIEPPMRVHLLRIPIRMEELYVSVEQPDPIRVALAESA